MDTYGFIEYGRSSTSNSKRDRSKAKEAFNKLKNWVNKKVIEVDNVIENSPLYMLNNAFDAVDDINDVEDDDFDNYMNDLNEFFSNVEESDLDNNNARHEFQALLSPNLSKLFGISPKSLEVPNDWVAPSKHGLSNSSPIIKRSQLKYEKENEYEKDSKSTEFKMEDFKGVRIDTAVNVDTKEEGKEYNHSEYDESETSSTISDDESIRITNMSPELMKLLNMDTTGMDFTTDWKPPDKPGLDNDKLKSLTNFTTRSEAK